MSTTPPFDRGSDATAPTAAGIEARRRRRTLGPCAHCHEPVDIDSEYVRLYRLAWHVDCALAAGGAATAGLAPPLH